MIKSVWRDIRKKRAQSIILFLVLLVIFTFEMVGLSIYTSAKDMEFNTQSKLGAEIDISTATEYMDKELEKLTEKYGSWEAVIESGEDIGVDVSESDYKKIKSINHIIGCNDTSGDFAVPDGFENVKEYTTEGNFDLKKQVVTDDSPQMKKDNVILDGHLDAKCADEFRKGYAKLTSGIFPDDEHRGAIVEEKLAQKNNFKIGDKITVHNTNDDSLSVTLEILGTYKTTEYFKVLKANTSGEGILVFQPSNRIYCDYSSGFELSGINRHIEALYVFVDSVENIETVIADIKTLDMDWSKYDVINYTKAETMNMSEKLSSFMNSAQMIVLISLVFGTILLALIVSFWSKSEMREAGIYMALGEKKSRIMLRKCIYIIIVVIVALALAVAANILIDSLLSGQFVLHYSDGMTNSTSGFESVAAQADEVLNVAISPMNVVICALSGILFSLASVAGSIINIVRKKSNDILRKETA